MYRIVADAAIFTATLPRIFTYTNSGIWLPSIGDRGNKRENRKLYAPLSGWDNNLWQLSEWYREA